MVAIKYLDQVMTFGQRIKTTVFEEYGQVALVTLMVLLILLIVILYRYTFKSLNARKMKSLNYYKDLALQPLPPCSTIPEELQHRLCDYYIATSYNTPNMNNHQFDYVSVDMVVKALMSGARFIQLPVCSYSMNQQSVPVVCQSPPDQRHITSLNTLSIREVFVKIRDFAFKYIDNTANQSTGIALENYNAINYPLIVQLKLHTDYEAVLNAVYTDIKEIAGRFLLDPKPYFKKPIQLAPICSLLNKIIIIATPGYENSQLAEIVTPTDRLFKTLSAEQLAIEKLTPEQREDYTKSLSMSQQRQTYAYMDNLAPLIKDILDAPDAIMETPGLTDKLTVFNMIGMTVVEPTGEDNINPMTAFGYGCQCVAMNYQTDDEFMRKYIEVFRKSSYVLKPSGLRLPVVEPDLIKLIDNYSLATDKNKLQLDPTFGRKYLEKAIYLQDPVTKKYLSPRGNNHLEFIELDRPGMNQLFLVKKSALTTDGIVLMSHTGLVITVDGSRVYLDAPTQDLAKLKAKTFYAETNGRIRLYKDVEDKEGGGYAILYLCSSGNKCTVRSTDPTLFTMGVVETKEVARITQAPFGAIKLFPGGIIALSRGGEGSKFLIINVAGQLITATSRVVFIKSVDTRAYLRVRTGSLLCDVTAEDKATPFLLTRNTNDDISLAEPSGAYITANPDGTLTLKKEYTELSPAVKDSKGKVLKSARMAPGIGPAKLFQLDSEIQLA